MKLIWRWVSGILIAAFCLIHLSLILIQNLPQDTRNEIRAFADNVGQKARRDSVEFTPMRATFEDALDVSKGYTRLIHAPQSWGMFAPNVGTRSDAPCLAIYYVGGGQEILYSPTQPRLRHVEPGFNFLNRFSELKDRLANEPRILDVNWRLHVLDARIRKLEGYVLAHPDHPGLISTRRGYIRWRLIEHLRANPRHQGKVERVELYLCSYQHPSFYGAATLTNVKLLAEYKPSGDPVWPKDLPAEPKR